MAMDPNPGLPPALPGEVVPISPVPMTVNVTSRRVGKDGMVVVDVYTPQGHSAYYFPPDVAAMIGAEMNRQAGVARTGLVIPQNGLGKL